MDSVNTKLCHSRRLLQNPYAHLNDVGNFDFAAAIQAAQQIPTHPDGQTSKSRQLLQNPYAYQNDTGDFDSAPMRQQTPNKVGTSRQRDARKNKKVSYSKVKQAARNLQLIIWKRRHELWPNGAPSDPVKLLDPEIAAKCIGFELEHPDYLGEFHQYGANKQIAGIIDRDAKRISISRRLPNVTRRFTSAHEIGHALLHQETVMHRDRPIEGPAQTQGPRDAIETEADKFATYFLMPEKLVRARFKQIFNVNTFALSYETAFALEPTNPEDLMNRCKTTRDLARVLAKAEHYNGRNIHSLAAQFGVSFETMAIRLEELRLINDQ